MRAEQSLRLSIILTLHNSIYDIPMVRNNIAQIPQSGAELIIIDDGSTDGTENCLKDLETLPRVTRVLRNASSLGVGASRNSALRCARGEYVWFVDSDDEWHPGVALGALGDAPKSDVVVGQAYIVRGDRTRLLNPDHSMAAYRHRSMVELLALGVLHGYLWDKLIRRTFLGENPFPTLSSQSDFVGVLRVADNDPVVCGVRRNIYTHLLRSGSLSQSKNPNLDNLGTCLSALRQNRTSGIVSPQMLDYFSVWFVALPSALTPTRNGASQESVEAGLRIARKLINVRTLASTLRFSRRNFALALFIRMAGGLVPRTYGYARNARSTTGRMVSALRALLNPAASRSPN